ncbi:hypothetical protein I350_06992 [Cryptococcus amylolentus CBS 6273]|uniref:Uncharacterized protein n=1 Tax=Cryptococcus amylolentus CBS 6273 TaxID=1296118 RepID=A0A1E3JI78_9TREE|nr:hypothetical protein I350_06992 [Cryptococcus amylolentus CBS 6273]
MSRKDSPSTPAAVGQVAEEKVGDGKLDGSQDGSVDIPTTRATGYRDLSDSEVAQFPGVKREHWWELWRPRHSPPPPKASLEDADIIPLATASILSKLTFQWVTPIMVKGYQRPLQATDLWKLDESREAQPLSTRFMECLEIRQMKASEWNESLPTATPTRKQRVKWAFTAATKRRLGSEYARHGSDSTYNERRATLEKEWRECSGKRHGSVTWALNDTLSGFWAGGLFKVFGDTSQIMIPLLVKSLINFSKEVYAAHQSGEPEPNIGRGVGMAIGLFLLTVMQSICQHQFFFRSMATGVLARGVLIAGVYKKSMNLSVEGRTAHPNGRLLSYMSSDISRVDYCAQCESHQYAVWTAPIQLILTLILLIIQIGPSALVGFSLFVILAPLQTWFMKFSFKIRKKSMVWTDSRSRLLRELLSSMEIIKVFTYEIPFLKRLKNFRKKEMAGVRKILMIRAANQALAFSVPSLASVLAFVTYAASHDNMDPALIFTSLAFFNLLRQPLMFLPRALSSLTDAQNAMERLTEVFEASDRAESTVIDPSIGMAIRTRDVSFSWSKLNAADAREEKEKNFDAPFGISSLSIEVPWGKIVAIVGPVGSGKSSILQGLIGEMPQLGGSVTFGGRLAYCQQSAWIQNATLRDNITFGQPWDEQRYWQVVRDACLVPDLEILGDGDLTEIGEKGINLSGGQKQRVNIARAFWSDAIIQLFDDPLSAVDAHVGKSLFENAILPLREKGKTVVLVTHALHLLPQVDHIYAIRQGTIVEQGTYTELIACRGLVEKLMTEFGGLGGAGEEERAAEEETALDEDKSESTKRKPGKVQEASDGLKEAGKGKAAGTGKLEGRLMVSEVRKTGSVGGKVYKEYLKAGKAKFTVPLTILFAVIMQGSSVMSTVWLTWWENSTFHQAWSTYQGVYAVLGISSSIFIFAMGATMGIIASLASNKLHSQALENVFYCPKSVFDTQPLGRVLGVFGKDFDTIDNQLVDSWRMMAMTLVTLIGSIIIITVYLHYFIIIIFGVGIGYWYFAMYYRTSSRELKRLDSMLRSLLYSHFSESLSGIATIRAYSETPRFIKDNTYYVDLENRAYLLTATNQRWLSVRLDFLGALLVFAVAIMCAKGGGGITASEIALCLTYLTSVTQVLGMVTRQSAEVENNMNAVERVLWYSNANELPQEAAHHLPSTDPPMTWPGQGAVEFKDAVMSYRPGLPPVLKGLSLSISAGEKVGIIGRTGAGKTSITMALFRLVELTSGSISIDSHPIDSVGLSTLRSRIAIIPQDPVLFSGTVRSNLDPFMEKEDVVLWDALKRAKLVGEGGREKDEKTFGLDSVIEEEGSNLSVGERSLLSLARALVKDSKIVILDEATAAVDLETDAKIQSTIHREFSDKTLLCIAHRLRTIISWDRILVMNAGQIEEFDKPLVLYDREDGHFRALCDKSNISREEISKARQSEWA